MLDTAPSKNKADGHKIWQVAFGSRQETHEANISYL